MPKIRSRSVLACWALVLIAGCAAEPETVRLGSHAFTYQVPSGWKAQREGDVLTLSRGSMRFALSDRGRYEGEFEPWCRRELVIGFGHGNDRTLARQRSLPVDGHRGFSIETWNRSDHGAPRRFVFVINGASILAVHSGAECPLECGEAMDALLATVDFIGG